MEEIQLVSCFSQDDIGPAREGGKINIFQSHNQFFIRDSIAEINVILRGIFKVPQALERFIDRHSRLLALDIKQFKREYKTEDYPVEKYKEELQANKCARLDILRFLFENRLNCGLFIIRCDHLKKQFLSRLDELNKVLFQCIKKKIDQTNTCIEQEVESVLRVINKEPLEDIEELSQVSLFLQELPQKQMLKIKGLIQDAMSKMSLLEDYECKLQEDEFGRTWRSFSKPLEIFKSEAECRKRMKRDERDFF
jgi:hypothetical protein